MTHRLYLNTRACVSSIYHTPQVDGVLFEITLGQLGQAGAVQNRRVAEAAAAPAAEEKVDDEDAEMAAMRARLQKISS